MPATWLDPAAADTAGRIAALPGADVYHDPAYILAVAGADPAGLLLVEEAGARLFLPVVLRPLPAQFATSAEAVGRCDGESPYGYACPLGDLGSDACWAAAAEALAQRGVLNLFLRSHPLQPWGDLPSLVRPITQSPTVAIPLVDDTGAPAREQAFAGARVANHRSQVNRARKLGFTSRIEAAPSAEALAVFRTLYERTMDRLGATDFYRFGDAHWQHLRGLGERMVLITIADPAGAVHNQALFLRGPRFAHYHLSARSDEAHNAGGNLLFEAAADWAAGPSAGYAQGCAAIHLGGGTTGAEDDSLLAYKRRIGRSDALFQTAGLIADPASHQRVVESWATASGKPPRWFQAYRQPVG